jgi:hypothetical protein
MATPESIESVGASDATPSLPEVRTIAPRDLLDVLAKDFDDFLTPASLQLAAPHQAGRCRPSAEPSDPSVNGLQDSGQPQ